MEGLGAGFQAERAHAAKSMTMCECATEMKPGEVNRSSRGRQTSFLAEAKNETAARSLRKQAKLTKDSESRHMPSARITLLAKLGPNLRHERRAKGRAAAFGTSARWRG